MDKELSSLVRRTLSTVSGDGSTAAGVVLRAEYAATTNRMLRVSVNGFMENLALVLEVMEELDVDALEAGKQRNESD